MDYSKDNMNSALCNVFLVALVDTCGVLALEPYVVYDVPCVDGDRGVFHGQMMSMALVAASNKFLV